MSRHILNQTLHVDEPLPPVNPLVDNSPGGDEEIGVEASHSPPTLQSIPMVQ